MTLTESLREPAKERSAARHDQSAVCAGWEQAYGLGDTVTQLVEWFGREDVT